MKYRILPALLWSGDRDSRPFEIVVMAGAVRNKRGSIRQYKTEAGARRAARKLFPTKRPT